MTRLYEQVTSGIAPLDLTYTEIAAPHLYVRLLFTTPGTQKINLVCRFLTTFLATKQHHSNRNMTHVQSATSEKTLDELRRVVVNLPTMPKNIVDDTRHEKVLSYVAAFIAQADPTLMQTMLREWAILDIFQVRLITMSCLYFWCIALG